jgi:hypothetical protein
MPDSTCQHYETWYLEINRAGGDEWPDMKPYASASYEIRPDRITAKITRDNPRPHVTVSGLRVKKDGTTGSLRANHTVWNGEEPWVAGVVRAARSRHNVTEEALSR